MRKRGLRLLIPSLGFLGFLCVLTSARCAKAQAQTPDPPKPNLKPSLSGKIELSCQRYLPLEPVDIVLTITNNGDTDYTFLCNDWWAETRFIGQLWGKPFPKPDDDMLSRGFGFDALYNASDPLPIAPHQSKRFYYYRGMNLSYWERNPGHYQIRLLFRGASAANSERFTFETSSEPFGFEIGALSREDNLARSYLEEHSLNHWIGSPELFSPSPEMQQEFQEFLRRFPRSPYVPWVKLALLTLPYYQVQSEMRRVQSLIREIQRERYKSAEPGKKPALLSDGEVFQRVLDERPRWEKQFGPQVVGAFLEGQGKGMLPSQKQILQDLEPQVVALAPTLPAPIDGYAWLAAMQIAASLGHTEARNRYLDKAVASSGETHLPAELRLRKEIIASGWQPATP